MFVKSDVLLWTPTYGQTKAGRPARTYIRQLCEDTECSPEDLPEAMNDRGKWRERVRDIRASGTTWLASKETYSTSRFHWHFKSRIYFSNVKRKLVVLLHDILSNDLFSFQDICKNIYSGAIAEAVGASTVERDCTDLIRAHFYWMWLIAKFEDGMREGPNIIN